MPLDPTMTKLSKSKLLSFLNCPKSLWLDVNRRELKQDSAASEAKFKVGHTIGEISQRIYDPKQVGTVFDPQTIGYGETCVRTVAALSRRKPVFEAGFATEDAWSFADVMLPIRNGGNLLCWFCTLWRGIFPCRSSRGRTT